MGYRLELYEPIYRASGGKLYGYVDGSELEKLSSYKWLLNRGFVNGDEYWDYGFDNPVLLTADEFKEFISLYNDDFNNYHEGGNVINNKDVQKLLKKNCEVLLVWE